MSKKIHSPDSNSDSFKEVWEEMDEIDPLTPHKELEDSYNAFKNAAEIDGYMFNDYDPYDSYKEG